MAESHTPKAQQIIRTHIMINAALDVLSVHPVFFILNVAYKAATAYMSYQNKTYTLSDHSNAEGEEAKSVKVNLHNDIRTYALAGELAFMLVFPSTVATLSSTMINAILNAFINYTVDSELINADFSTPRMC